MKKRVVIVEDDAYITDSLKIILDREGLEVTCYADDSIITKPEESKPDIYLIDKQLSGVDGLDICKHLKQSTQTAHIPVVILSATSGIERLVMAAGANAFIEKPFSKSDLMQVIRNFI